MTQTQIDKEIMKTKMQLVNARDNEKKSYRKIEESEQKLSKLKSSLDKTANDFSRFDKLNERFKNTTQLQFVNTWIESFASNNSYKKSSAYRDMDDSYKEQKRELSGAKNAYDNYRNKRIQLEKKLHKLEEQRLIASEAE